MKKGLLVVLMLLVAVSTYAFPGSERSSCGWKHYVQH